MTARFPAVLICLCLVPASGWAITTRPALDFNAGPMVIVSLVNGDEIRGTLDAIDGAQLVFRPALAPQTAIRIDLARVNSLRSGSKPVSAPGAGTDALTLQDGTTLRGTFVAFTTTAVRFEVSDFGRLEFPLAAMAELTRGKAAPPLSAERPGFHVLRTTRGDVLTGRFSAMPDGMVTVTGGAVEARLSTAVVASISAPRPAATSQPASRPAAKPRTTATLVMAGGMTVTGEDPRIEDGCLAVTLYGGRRVRARMERIADVSFDVAGRSAAPRGILAWGRFSDRGDEFKKTLDILRGHFGPRRPIIENFNDTFGPDFRRALSRCGTVVVPEMEQWGPPNVNTLVQRFKPVIHPFLRRGRIIFLCITSGTQSQFLREAGLLDVQTSGSSVAAPFTLAGRRITKGVTGDFKQVDATSYYRIGPAIKAEAWAGTAAQTPIVGRRVGRGWVILMGMDYFAHTEQTKQLLINAVEFR